MARWMLSPGMFSLRRGQDRGAQARIVAGIGQPVLGGDGDLARQLGEQLGAHLILAPLAVHDVLELGMAGHVKSWGSSWSGRARWTRLSKRPATVPEGCCRERRRCLRGHSRLAEIHLHGPPPPSRGRFRGGGERLGEVAAGGSRAACL